MVFEPEEELEYFIPPTAAQRDLDEAKSFLSN